MVNPLGELTIEQAQYMDKFPPPQNFNPYAQRFNLGWKNHLKLSWRKQNVMNPMEQMKPLPSHEKNSSLEETMKKLTNIQMKMQKSQNKFVNETRTSLNNQEVQIWNLEVQMGQMASLFNERQHDNLPSTLEVNPKGVGVEH